MRRTYRDGTRTLFPARTVWPLCRTFFCSRASSPEKSAAARAPACAAFTGNKTTPSLPPGGKRPVLRTFVPALLKLLSTRQGPTFPLSSRPSRPSRPAASPVRCAVPRGTTARQHKASPRNRLWYRVSGRCLCRIRQVPCPWPLPCPYCLLERRAARTNHTAPAGPADCTSS